jgi:hypothetical protein
MSCLQSGFSGRSIQLRGSVCSDGSIAGRVPQWSVLLAPSSRRRYGRGSHPLQLRHPRTLYSACLCCNAKSCSLLVTAAVALPTLTKSLKGITAKRASAWLGLTGCPFWQPESYDHVVQHERVFENIRNYIERSPVRAGLVREPGEYRWSSARSATWGSPADQGVRPTKTPSL